MKFIVFDGDFNEVELEWLEEWGDEEDWDAYAKRMDLRLVWQSSSSGMHETEVYSFGSRSYPNRAWYVLVTIACSDILRFVIEGDQNYLRFLASPFALANVERALATMTETVRRTFNAWHGHEAPDGEDDHSLENSCDVCDPKFTSARDQQRKKQHEWQEKRRQKEIAEREARLQDGPKERIREQGSDHD